MRVRILVSSPSDTPPLTRPFGPPSPLRGEDLGRAAPCGRPYAPTRTFRGGRVRTPAPTAETDPGTLVRTTQAQEWNRGSSNFPLTQAPSGAGRDRTQALLILRAGRILPTSRGNPRNGGPGKGDYEHEVLIRSRSRRRNSPAKRTIQRPDEGIGPYKKRSIIAPSSGPFGATFPIPSGLRPSPLDKGSRPPRGRL